MGFENSYEITGNNTKTQRNPIKTKIMRII